jgi:glyoxylase I family protein
MRAHVLHHLAISASELDVSTRFYDQILDPFGYTRTVTSDNVRGWTGPDPEILLYRARREHPIERHILGLPGWHHAAFIAESRGLVDEVYRILVEEQATVLDAPAEYPRYGEGYYAVYFEDPDGLKLEVAFVPGHLAI